MDNTNANAAAGPSTQPIIQGPRSLRRSLVAGSRRAGAVVTQLQQRADKEQSTRARFLEQQQANHDLAMAYEGEARPGIEAGITLVRDRWLGYLEYTLQCLESEGMDLPPSADDADLFPWVSSTIKGYACSFLLWLAETSVGSDRKSKIRVSTLFKTAQLMVQLFHRHACDLQGQSVGSKLLLESMVPVGAKDAKGQFRKKVLFDALFETVALATTEHHLIQTPCERHWFGPLEARLVIEELLAEVVRSPPLRDAKLQLVTAILCSFVLALRVGAMASSYKDKRWVELERYMQFGDVQVFRDKDGNLHSRWTVRTLKGHASVLDGKRLVFRVTPPTLPQNVVFDLTLIHVVRCWQRGFIKGYDSLEDLLGDTREGVITIDDAMDGKRPLFHAIGNGGRFSEARSAKPMNSDNLSACLREAYNGVNLPNGGFRAFRRESGDNFGNIHGGHAASIILGHADDMTTADNNYSRSTEAFDVMADALGESDAARASLKRKQALALTLFSSAAIRAKTRSLEQEAAREADPEPGAGYRVKQNHMGTTEANQWLLSQPDYVALVDEYQEAIAQLNQLCQHLQEHDPDSPESIYKPIVERSPEGIMRTKCLGDPVALELVDRTVSLRSQRNELGKSLKRTERKPQRSAAIARSAAGPIAQEATEEENESRKEARGYFENDESVFLSKQMNLQPGTSIFSSKAMTERSKGAAALSQGSSTSKTQKSKNRLENSVGLDTESVAGQAVIRRLRPIISEEQIIDLDGDDESADQSQAPASDSDEEDFEVPIDMDEDGVPSSWEDITADAMRGVLAHSLCADSLTFPMPCPECPSNDPKRYRNFDAISKHYRAKHPDDELQHWCLGGQATGSRVRTSVKPDKRKRGAKTGKSRKKSKRAESTNQSDEDDMDDFVVPDDAVEYEDDPSDDSEDDA